MRNLVGVVISTSMEKTVVVEVRRIKVHPVYKKRFRVKKKYHAHDNLGVKKGDKVEMKEIRPMSKTKKWEVIKVIKKGH